MLTQSRARSSSSTSASASSTSTSVHQTLIAIPWQFLVVIMQHHSPSSPNIGGSNFLPLSSPHSPTPLHPRPGCSPLACRSSSTPSLPPRKRQLTQQTSSAGPQAAPLLAALQHPPSQLLRQASSSCTVVSECMKGDGRSAVGAWSSSWLQPRPECQATH